MKRFFCTAALALSLTALAVPPASAVDSNSIRVGLAYGSTAPASITLSCPSGFFVNGTRISDSTITVQAVNGVLSVSGNKVSAGTSLTLAAQTGTCTYNGAAYEGEFELSLVDGRIQVVNEIPLDTYLKGVVPYEMSASWPLEALKAQAICARSYALGSGTKHAANGFDVCATTHCQVYRGTERATANSNTAVDATSGLTLYADGKPVVGYFFACDGGATEDAANVWGGEYSYLTGVKDPYEDTANASNGVWSVTLTAEEVRQKINAAGHALGQIASVQVTRRTAMDNVNQVTVTDTAGNTAVLNRSACRTVFGLNSLRYTVSGGANTSVYAGTQSGDTSGYSILSADGTVERITSLAGQTVLSASGIQTIPGTQTVQSSSTAPAGSFTFTGTGWGHQVGMSQYGAKAMAEQGFTYDEILKFYFTGISIGK